MHHCWRARNRYKLPHKYQRWRAWQKLKLDGTADMYNQREIFQVPRKQKLHEHVFKITLIEVARSNKHFYTASTITTTSINISKTNINVSLTDHERSLEQIHLNQNSWDRNCFSLSMIQELTYEEKISSTHNLITQISWTQYISSQM